MTMGTYAFQRTASDGARWERRAVIARALRLAVLLTPVLLCVAASFAVTRLVPAPRSLGPRVLWLVGIVAACSLLAWPARRQLRRILPLAALLELALLFPGEAPSRWKVAREAGSIKHLQLLASGLPETEPTKAATTILALVASLARHDRVTRGHSERVRVFTDMIADEMALPRAARDRLRWAALIHDVGKLEVPSKLLRKPGKPTRSEWDSLRLHPEIGARLTEPLAGWLGEYAAVVIEHHERFDGTGYPRGLCGEQISLGARIVGLADAFEVITSARPYKRAFSRQAALREIASCSGTHFDPAVVRALLAVSTPRLRRALGPLSWIGQLPVVGTAPVGGLPSVAGTVARGAGTVMLGGVASAVVVGSTGAVSVPSVQGGSQSSLHDETRQDQAAPDPAAKAAVAIPTQRTVLSAPTAAPSAADVAGAPPVEPPAAGSAPSATLAPNSQQGDSIGGVGVPAGAVDGTVGGVGGAVGGVGGAVGGVGGAVGGTVDGVVGTVAGVVDGLTGTVGGVVDGVTDGVGGTVDGVVDGVTGTVDGVVDGAGGTVGGVVDGVTDGVGGTVDGVVDGVTSTVDGVTGGVAGTVDGVVDGVGGLLGGSSQTSSADGANGDGTSSDGSSDGTSDGGSGGGGPLGGLLGGLLGG